MPNSLRIDSPLGTILIEEQDGYLCRVEFSDEVQKPGGDTNHPVLNKAAEQLKAYFDGQLRHFDLPVKQVGTPFQQKVWDQLLEIPFGQRRSYLDLSLALGDRNLTRAVGNANGKNKIAIIVPCHRVIGANDKLVGYAAGLWRKAFLLKHEGIQLAALQPSLF